MDGWMGGRTEYARDVVANFDIRVFGAHDACNAIVVQATIG